MIVGGMRARKQVLLGGVSGLYGVHVLVRRWDADRDTQQEE